MKYQSVYNRLRRIEGQIRGIGEMVSKNSAETEIIVQLEAASASLRSTLMALVKEMLNSDKGDVVITMDQANSILRLLK